MEGAVQVDVRDQMIGHLPRLRRFALAITGDAIEADDLVQETCLKALSNLNQFQAGTRLDSWLFRIAKNAWLDKIKKVSSRTDHVDIDTAPELQDPTAQEVVEHRAALRDTSRAIAQLPEELSDLLILICIDGRSYEETAQMMELPIGTVMSRLARARRQLHQTISSNPSRTPTLRKL